MKIEINIDIEAIVREEIRNYIREYIVINNVTDTCTDILSAAADMIDTAVTTVKAAVTSPVIAAADSSDYEYAPEIGKRFSAIKKAYHRKELELGRRLTPEEKGEVDALQEVDDETQKQAKINTKNKIRIDGIAEEATEAAVKELAEEAAEDDQVSVTSAAEDTHAEALQADQEEEAAKEEAEATIPKTEEVKTNSLFS